MFVNFKFTPEECNHESALVQWSKPYPGQTECRVLLCLDCGIGLEDGKRPQFDDEAETFEQVITAKAS